MDCRYAAPVGLNLVYDSIPRAVPWAEELPRFQRSEPSGIHDRPLLTGWTNTGSGIINWHNSAEMRYPFDGARVADLNNGGNGLSDTGILSQSFTTDVGASYQLTFYLAGPGTSFPDPRQVQVDIAGIQRIFSQAASPNTALVWGSETLTFTAIAATTTLAFTSVNGSGYWGLYWIKSVWTQ